MDGSTPTHLRHFDLRSFDLNLLVAMDALLIERSVTRAAARLKIGQPAMSQQLAALRLLLQDDLLVRVGAEMQPTPRAVLLAAPLRQALTAMQGLIDLSQETQPQAIRRTFRCATTPDLEALLLPPLVARLAHLAPQAKLLASTPSSDAALDELDDGRVDFVVACLEGRIDRQRSTVLLEQELVCVYNPAALDFRQGLSEAEYLQLPHVAMTGSTELDGCLAEAVGIYGRLDIIAACASASAAVAIVAAVPALATLPRHLAIVLAPRLGLAIAPLPILARVPPLRLLWSIATDRDPVLGWFRGLVADTLAGIGTIDGIHRPDRLA